MRFLFNPVTNQLNAAPPRDTIYAATAPVNPPFGTRWANTQTLREYLYIDGQWVEVGVGPAGKQGDKGDAATVAVGPTTTGAAGTNAAVTNSGTTSAAVLNFTVPKGDTGTAATVAVGTTTTGATGTNAAVTNSGSTSAAVLDFTIPQGVKGDAATVAVGTTTTGAAGTNAAVSNSGTTSAAVLNFTVPKGDTGTAATIALAPTVTGAAGSNALVENTGTTSAAVFKFTIPQGAQGAQGPAATVAVGTTTTGAAGTNAAVSNSGTTSAAVLNFTVPQGVKGDTGTAATVAVGTTTTGAAGTSAAVTNSGTTSAAVLNFTVPKGDPGKDGTSVVLKGAVTSFSSLPTTNRTAGDLWVASDTGDGYVWSGTTWTNTGKIQGPGATVAVGTTTTGAAGTSALVTNSGTTSAAVLNFTVPRGNTGDAATVSVGTTTTGAAGTSAAVSNSGTTSAAVLNFTVPRGAQGLTGAAATVAVGTTTTGAAGTSALVTNSGTTSAAVLNFTVPQGTQGVKGDRGDAGPQGPAGPAPSGTGAVVVSNGSLATPVAYGSANTVSTLVQRDTSGSFSAGTITASLTGSSTSCTGNAATATKLATSRTINVSGDLTGTAQSFDGGANITIPVAFSPGAIVNADIDASAAIADSKLAAISTAGKVLNSATTATNANTASAIVARDALGNFSANTITASLTGNASSATKLTTAKKINDVSFDGSADITISAVPTSHTHPYSQITDSPYKDGVTVATTAALTANYANGTSGVGATLTFPTAYTDPLNTLVIDSVPVTVGMRVLVKNQASTFQNGIYAMTTLGSASAAWVLTRATDSDSKAELGGAIVSVDRGTSGGKLFSTSFKTTDTVGTTACLWQQIYDQGDASTANTANTLVLRDGSGNFSGGVVTATQIVANSATPTVGAVAGVAGLMSAADKTKLDGVATNANNYAHPTGDGNLHVPATSTTNNGRVLKAGSTAGSVSWGTLTAADVGAAASSHSHPYSQITDSPYKDGVTVATTTNLSAVYSNGASGVGATLQNTGTVVNGDIVGSVLIIDGLTVSSVGTRVLIKDQTTSAQNGIYTLTTAGSTTVAWVLTRATDADTNAELGGAVVSVDRGTANGGKLFSTSFTTSNTIGTSSCSWQQIFDQADAATTNTANKLVLRDSAGGFRAGEIISTSLLSGAIVSQGNITVQNTSPRLILQDIDTGGLTYYVYVNGENFYVLADRDASGNWESPHPLQLNAVSELARVFGYDILHTGNSTAVSAWVTKTAAYTAVAGDRIVANTTTAAFIVTLPAAPAQHDEVTFADYGKTWDTRNLTIARNGKTIEGLSEDLVCNVEGVQFTMRYEGTTWRIYT